jgi:tetratricopeptide (TPR) repeat protein
VDDPKVFEFIDFIVHQPKDNWIETFKDSVELREKLKVKLLTQPPKKASFPSSLHNQTPPEENFVGRVEMLKTITEWYNDPEVRIGALIGWGGVGKSALVRKWYESLEENKIQPDGIFWWGFYGHAYLDQFLNALLRYVSHGQIDPDSIKDSWQKTERIKEYIYKGTYLIILDGLEQMQKGEETGEGFGCMAHLECTDLLRFLSDTKAKGLCLITTRYPLTDIKNYEGTTYQNIEIDRLELEDARALFEKVGVKGDQKEKDKVIEEYKGHALSLTLLSGYLVQDFGGNIEKANQIPKFHSDKEAGGKAHRILLWYDKQLTLEQRSFMKIFSLFRRAVYEEDFDGVFRAKMETKMNQALRNMSLFSFNRMKDNLCDRRLISKGQDINYATHPLVKNYFESIFEEKDKKLCHKRIYQFIGSYAPGQPETLEQMQPLFEQVYHGCAARLYDEVLNNVYWTKICREKYFITHNLGAWNTNLSLISNFFPVGGFSKLPLVSDEGSQSLLLNEAGLGLMVTGRPKEAEGLLMRKTIMQIKNEDWLNVSIGFMSLSQLQFLTGEIQKGLKSSRKALEMAKKSGFGALVLASVDYMAYILHLLGENKEAEILFKRVDQSCREITHIQFYGMFGAYYTNVLIENKKVNEALEVARQNLRICENENLPADISQCHRCLGAIERIKGNSKQAEAHLQKAIEFARKVGIPYLEIEALLEYGRLYLEKGEYEHAINAGNEVLRICQRTGFLLYEPDAEVILAKAYLAQNNFDQAKTFANSALSKAQKMSYKLAENDASQLLKEILA